MTCTVADMTESNIRPQESGKHMDCTVVACPTGRSGASLKPLTGLPAGHRHRRRRPNIMPEFKYSAKRDYTLKFLIRVEAEQ